MQDGPAVRDLMTTLPSMPLLPGQTPRRTVQALGAMTDSQTRVAEQRWHYGFQARPWR